MTTEVVPAGFRARISAIPADALARLALRFDAIITGANGIAYVALAGPLESALGIEAAALRGAGAFLIAFAAGLWLVSMAREINPRALGAVAGANAIWAADSVVVAVAGWLSPTTIGTVWIVLQATTVAAFAALQYAALRGLRPQGAAGLVA